MLLKEFGAYWGAGVSPGRALDGRRLPDLAQNRSWDSPEGEGRDAECTVRRGIRVQVALIQTENRALDKLNGDTRPHGLHMELLP